MEQSQPKQSFSLRILQKRFFSWLWGPSPGADTKSVSGFFWPLLRVISVFVREFDRDNIPLRASALTFTIVLSLVPTLALGTAVLKGLGAGDQMRQAAYRFIDQLDVEEAPKEFPANENTKTDQHQLDAEADTAGSKDQQQMANHMRQAADQIFDYVDRTDFATLGAFGVIGLVFAVLSVLGSIEQSMNVIWQADRGRPFGRKLMDYLALMILLPLSVNLALATETMIQNQTLLQMVYQYLPVEWVTDILLKILPALLVMVTFFILYRFLPNTNVGVFPALVGGAVGGVSWLLIQGLYIKLQFGVARYNAIYGSFATLPLFLLWLYIAWVVFLAGAEVSFACQYWREYQWEKPKLKPLHNLALAFSLLETICDDYGAREVSTSSSLAANYHYYSLSEIEQVLQMLSEGGFVRQVRDKKNGYVPAAPMEEIELSEIVEHVLGVEDAQKHPMAAEAIKAAADSVAKYKFSSTST